MTRSFALAAQLWILFETGNHFLWNPPSSETDSSKYKEYPPPGINMNSMASAAAFEGYVAQRYDQHYGEFGTPNPGDVVATEEEVLGTSSSAEQDADQAKVPKPNAISAKATGGGSGLGRQVWHTPTELFRPYYCRILAKALLTHYQLHHWPYADFSLYEVGAGNGSLMIDTMCWLRDQHPEVFDRTRYTIVEISKTLAERQRERIKEYGLEDKVTVENVDFFTWRQNKSGPASSEPCYFIALEVLDNFSHDMVRYDMKTLEPYQAIVCIDETGDFSLLYEKVTDPLIRRYLDNRSQINYPYEYSTSSSSSSIFGPLKSF